MPSARGRVAELVDAHDSKSCSSDGVRVRFPPCPPKSILIEFAVMRYLNIKEAVKALDQGKLVIFPTETVYGIGADGFNEAAVRQIYKIKERPITKPITMHVSSFAMMDTIVKSFDRDVEKLFHIYWPGPLTIVLEKSEKVPYVVSASKGTVGIRFPDNDKTLELIDNFGRPIAGTSVNKAGAPSLCEPVKIIEEMSQYAEIAGILDDGASRLGQESTVIDMTKETPLIVREGYIKKEELSEVLRKEVKILGID